MKRPILATMSVAVAAMVMGAPAQADNVMKVCGAKYQAAKTGNTLPAGETWNQFLAQCRGSLPKTAAAAPVVAPAAASKGVASPRSAGQQSAAMVAMHDRQRQCGTQWKTDKAAGKIPAGQTWPKYWSACNTRLKG